MSKILVLINIFLFSIVLGGCWDYSELDDTSFVSSIGVNYIEETDEIEMFLNILNPDLLSKVEVGGSSDTINNSIGSTTCKSVKECFSKIQASTTQNVVEQYAMSLVVSMDFLEHYGIDYIVEVLNNYGKNTHNFYVYATDEDIDQLFNMEKIQNTSTLNSILTNPLPLFKYDSRLEATNYLRLYRNNVIDTKNVVLNVLSLEEVWSEEEKFLNSAYVSGVVYVNDYTILHLEESEYKGLALIHDGNYVTFNVSEELVVELYNYKYDLSHEDDVLIVNIDGTLLDSYNAEDLEDFEVIEVFRQYIISEIEKLVRLEIDILEVEDYEYRHGVELNKIGFNIILNMK